jgi:4-hydroxy-tetrahydrodipicolinate synthase
MQIEGSWPAIVTPYDESGDVNFKVFDELIDFHVKYGSNGILIMGSTGESTQLSLDERRDIIAYAAEYSHKKIPVFFGCTCATLFDTIELAQYAEDVNAFGLVLVVPPYVKPPQEAVLDFFKRVADSVSLPIAIYNNPARVGVNIPPETMIELSKIKNIVADKEAIPNVSQLQEIKNGAEGDFSILCCDYPGYSLILPTLAMGGSGTANVAGNVVPEEMAILSKPWETYEDVVKAREIYEELLPLLKLLYSVSNPVPVKAAVNLLGFKVGDPRPPLPIFSGDRLSEMTELLRGSGYIDKYSK